MHLRKEGGPGGLWLSKVFPLTLSLGKGSNPQQPKRKGAKAGLGGTSQPQAFSQQHPHRSKCLLGLKGSEYPEMCAANSGVSVVFRKEGSLAL